MNDLEFDMNDFACEEQNEESVGVGVQQESSTEEEPAQTSNEQVNEDTYEKPSSFSVFLVFIGMIVVMALFFKIVLPALDNSNHSLATDVIEKSQEDGYWKDVLRQAN